MGATHDQLRTDTGEVYDEAQRRYESLADVSAVELQGNQLPSSPSDGEVLRYDGTQWEHLADTDHGKLHKVVEGTVNAGHPDFTGANNAEKVDAAIQFANTNNHPLCLVPESLIPYDPTAMPNGHLDSVRMVREGQVRDGYDFMAYGADASGSNNSTSAIDAAIDAAVVNNGVALWPEGTFVYDGRLVDSSDSGLTILGDGYNSELKVEGKSLSGNVELFHVKDAGTAVENVTVKNGRLNGNKSNVTDNGYNVWGVLTVENGLDNRAIHFDRIWAHDFMTSGIGNNMAGVDYGVVWSWNNSIHGLSLDSAQGESHAERVYAWNNGEYGVNLSSGEISCGFAWCYNNTSGGIKTSTNALGVTIRTAVLVNNGGSGFLQTGACESFSFGHIKAIDNAEAGVKFGHPNGVTVNGGTIFAKGNNTSNTNTHQVILKDDLQVCVGSITAIDSANGRGVDAINNVRGKIDAVFGSGNQWDLSLRVYDTGANIVVGGGEIEKLQVNHDDGISTVADIRVTDTIDVNAPGNASGLARLVRLDLSDTNTFAIDSDPDIHITDVRGYSLDNEGNVSVSDTDTIAHGLDEMPSYVNLTASADKHIAVATAVDGTNITVGLHDDTGSAVTTDETVYWEARA